LSNDRHQCWGGPSKGKDIIQIRRVYRLPSGKAPVGGNSRQRTPRAGCSLQDKFSDHVGHGDHAGQLAVFDDHQAKLGLSKPQRASEANH